MARRQGYTKIGKRHEQRNEKRGGHHGETKKEEEEKGWPGLIRLLFYVLVFSYILYTILVFWSGGDTKIFFFSALDKNKGTTTFVFWEQRQDTQRDVRAALTVFTLMKSACGR